MDTQVEVAVVIAAGAVAAAALAASVASRELVLKRQLEITRSFLEILSVAHGRPRDGRPQTGRGENIAAIWLLGELGRSNTWLARSTDAALQDLAEHTYELEADKRTIAEARKLLRERSLMQVLRHPFARLPRLPKV